MLARFTAPLARGCMYVAVAGLSGIVAVVAIQVFGRYVLNDTPVWAESTALVLILYVTLLGAFGAIMAWNGAILGASVAPYKIPTLGISEAFSQAPLVISGALIVLFSIEHVVALIRGEEVKPAWH